VIPTPPLAERNRLATLVLAALADPGARAALGRLSEDPAESALVRRRARCAVEALAGCPPVAAAATLEAALDAAAVLFDAGLFFEVHEVLEPHWRPATGAARETLGGLIQVAVGYQHAANGNLAGARSLLAEGAARLHGARLSGRSCEAFARAACAWAEALTDIAPGTVPAFPRLA